MEGAVFSPARAHGLDELRGVSILLMVLYHALWNLHRLFGVSIPLFDHPAVTWLQALFAGFFVFASGMVCNTSRSNLRRGWVTLACGMAITVATGFALPQQTVRFGILHLLGCCMLLYSWASGLLRRIPDGVGFVLAAVLFALTWKLPQGQIGLAGWSAALPPQLYRWSLGFVLGLPAPNFASVDYFPLVPWTFLFLAGSFLGRTVFALRSPVWLFTLHLPPLAWVGRHTLWIYLLHQPLLFGLMALLFR